MDQNQTLKQDPSKTRVQFICLILALISLPALASMIKESSGLYPLTNSVLAIPVAAGLFLLYIKAAAAPKRTLVISTVFGFLFSVMMVLGKNILVAEGSEIGRFSTWFNFLAGTPMFAAMTSLFLNWTGSLNARVSKVTSFGALIRSWSSRRYYLTVWLLLFLAWIPVFLAVYPGIYAYDSVYQIEFYSQDYINLHHPLIHTLLMGWLIQDLGAALGSYEMGMAAYSILQMAALSAGFAAVLLWMRNQTLAFVFRLVFLALFLFLPVNALMAVSSTKDIYFSLFFLLMMLWITKAAENPERLKDWRFDGQLMLFAFLQMLFRNQGVYIFLFGMVVMLIVFHHYWKQLVLLAAAVCCAFSIYSGPVTTALRGRSVHSVNEYMSVPCVQLSKAMLDCPERLSDEQKALVEQYIPDWRLYPENVAIADSLKISFNSDLFINHPAQFIRLWVAVGLKCPAPYVDSFLRLTIGNWYPDMNYPDSEAYHPYWEYQNTVKKADGTVPSIVLQRHTPAILKPFSDWMAWFSENGAFKELPILSMLFSGGFLFWMLLLFCAWTINTRKWNYLVPFFFLFGLWGTLMLGPVVIFRYLYPLAVCVPLLVTVMLTQSARPSQSNSSKTVL